MPFTLEPGFRASIPQLPDQVDAMVLGAGTAESYTVPASVRHLLLSSDGAFYISSTGTAAAPATEVTDGTGSFYVPAGMYFIAVEQGTLSFIRAGGSTVTITIGRYLK